MTDTEPLPPKPVEPGKQTSEYHLTWATVALSALCVIGGVLLAIFTDQEALAETLIVAGLAASAVKVGAYTVGRSVRKTH